MVEVKYQKPIKKIKKAFEINKEISLIKLAENNKNEFWSLLKVKQQPHSSCQVPSLALEQHFRILVQDPKVLTYLSLNLLISDDDYLRFGHKNGEQSRLMNSIITTEELDNAFAAVKLNKATGVDTL